MPERRTTTPANTVYVRWYWPIAGAFSVTFTVFKLGGDLAWPWWQVLMPLWMPFAIVAGILIAIGVAVALAKVIRLAVHWVRYAFSPKYRARTRAMRLLKRAVDNAVRNVITDPSPEMRARINRGRDDSVWRF